MTTPKATPWPTSPNHLPFFWTASPEYLTTLVHEPASTPTPARLGTPRVRLPPHASSTFRQSLPSLLGGPPGTPRGTLAGRLLVRLKSQNNLGNRGLGPPVRLNYTPNVRKTHLVPLFRSHHVSDLTPPT